MDEHQERFIRRLFQTREDMAMEAVAATRPGYLAHLTFVGDSILAWPVIVSAVDCPPWCPGQHPPTRTLT